jgi:Tfp pilus assembly protein PilO
LAKLTDNQKSLLTIGVGALLAVGFGVLVYLDLGKIEEMEAEIEVQKTKKAMNDAEIARIPGLEKELVAYKRIVTDNAKILPTEDDIHAFLRELSSLEKDLGFTLRQVPVYKPESYKAVGSITKIPLKMQVTASTRSLLRFLNSLENRDRLVSISDIRINPTGETGRPGQDLEHEISLAFELYRYDPKAGPTGKFPITEQKFDQLLTTKEVKDILAAKGRPTSIERYQLLPGRDNRRDLFVDPRKRTDKAGGPREGPRGNEEAQLELLTQKYLKLELELESYRHAEKEKDFLRMAASKKNFLQAKEELESEIKKVSLNQPEFTLRDLQDRYLAEVKQPYIRLMAQAQDLVAGSDTGGVAVKITAELAAEMRKELVGLVEKGKFQDAADKWNGIDALVRDAIVARSLEDGARPHVDAMRKIGEEAKYQAILHSRKIEVQGIVRMEKSSAVIINGKTLFPGKALDKDVRFLRVEEVGKGEPDRIIFSVDGHEMAYTQPKPALLQSERALLEQE